MNKILDNIYLGNINDAFDYQGHTLYVHEDFVPGYTPTHHVPILSVESEIREIDEDRHFSRSTKDKVRIVDSKKLEDAFKILDEYRESKTPLLIHCLGGIERSPLTLALWLVRIKELQDLDAAYRYLQDLRPIVEDRRHWLND